jgi:CheY-like chemotaxis protein
LVIDDDADLLEAMRDALASEGYDCVEARDGHVALARLRTDPRPGVILLDWNMAPMSGAQFMDELARDAALAEVPVVLVTADVGVDSKALGGRFAGYLKKPLDLDVLFALVSRFCD